MPKKEKDPGKKTGQSKPEAAGTRMCHSDREFEEMFLPGALEKKKIEERIREPGKLKEHFLRKIRT